MELLNFGQILCLCLALPSISSIECPLSCQCYQQSGINSIFCFDAALTHIPNFFNFEVKILNFSGNVLPNLTDSFQNQHYKSLEILDLSRNGIASIEDRSFCKLKNLLEIDISRNFIRFINKKLFKNNRFLNTANFGGNLIEEIEDYAFTPSIYLRNLNFQGCRIKKIHKFAFVNTPMLEYLNLKENKLKSLSVNVLHFTSQLKQLSLDGNSWKCNKKLWILLKGLQSKNLTVDSLLCVYGETENAILWDTMDLNNPTKFQKRQVTSNVNKIKWSSTRKRKRVRRSSETIPTEQQKRNKIKRKRRSQYDVRSNAKERREDNAEDYVVDKPWLNFQEYQYDNSDPVTKLINFRGHRYQSSDTNNEFEDERRKSSQYKLIPYESNTKNGLELHPETVHSRRRPIANHKNEFHERLGEWNRITDANWSDNSFRKASENNKFVTDGGILTGRFVSVMKNQNGQVEPHITENVETMRTIREPFDNEISDGSSSSPETEMNFNESETNDTNDEPENMKIMLSFIAVELVLLIVLVYILYKLWLWNRRIRDSAANTPLNNCNKMIKTYDTNSPGYKRYSLSDEDYSNIRDQSDDKGIYDSESGYLSYHRYNSIEADNYSDDGQHRVISNSENMRQDSVRKHDNDNNTRRTRRSSSLRSVERKAKLEVCRRSVSSEIEDDDK